MGEHSSHLPMEKKNAMYVNVSGAAQIYTQKGSSKTRKHRQNERGLTLINEPRAQRLREGLVNMHEKPEDIRHLPGERSSIDDKQDLTNA